MQILVCGEALIDLVLRANGPNDPVPTPGGSPYNVAIGLARLGVETGYLGKISTDAHGRMLRAHLAESGVDLRFAVETARRTTTAGVRLKYGEEPEFVFDIENTADRSLLVSELPERLPDSLQAVHFGSYSLVLEPGASALVRFMEAAGSTCVITLDPNVRPFLIPARTAYRGGFERWCAMSDMVKLSTADLDYIDPGGDETRWVASLLAAGTALVVVTRGPRGATGYTARFRVDAPGEQVSVVDTIGAGDAFMSGLLAALCDAGPLTKDRLRLLSISEVECALRFATKVAAITCQKRGADPPTRAELTHD